MITRTARLLLLAGIALFYTFVVFNNLTDFDSNYQFVRHVLSMDSTFPGNRGMWRAIQSPALHLAFYLRHHRVGNCYNHPAVVGSRGASARIAPSGCRIQRRQAHSRDCTHALDVDVAGGVSFRWRRVVPHVAVAYVEMARMLRFACLP